MLAESSTRVRLHLLGLIIAILALVPGCDDLERTVAEVTDLRPGAVHLEPLDLVFHPGTGTVAVDVVNTGDEAVPLEAFRISGDDRDAFSLSEELPGAVAAGERARIEITINLKPFRERGDHNQTLGYRDGSARFAFKAGGELMVAPIEFEDPSILMQHVLPALTKIFALVMAFIMPMASLLTWMERRQSAMMQDRLGPNMAGFTIFGKRIRLWGLLHIAADGLKMLFKEDFVPRNAHRVLYTLAPLMAFIPALVVFAIVPFGDGVCYERLLDVVSQADVNQCSDGRGGTALQIARLDVGLLFYFAIASLATYGTVLAGWSSYNKWAILGGLRASAQMISYEVAIGLTIVGALLVYGTLEPHALVHAQLESHWGIILQPIALVLFFTAAMAETKRAPFDLPEGESEIIGYFVEYSGMRFGLFFLGEFIEIVFASALIATIFLGGWALPFGILGASGFSSSLAAGGFLALAGLVLFATGVAAFKANRSARAFGTLVALVGVALLLDAGFALFFDWGTELPHIAVAAIGLLVWGVKVAALCWLQLLVRWTLPRFRYDQLMTLGWKGLLPLSLANIVLTAIVMYLLIPGAEALR